MKVAWDIKASDRYPYLLTLYFPSLLEETMNSSMDDKSSHHGSSVVKPNGLDLNRSRRTALAEVDNAKFSFVALQLSSLVTIIDFSGLSAGFTPKSVSSLA